MKSFLALTVSIVLMFPICFTGCGDSNYNKVLHDQSIREENETNQGESYHNENWVRMPLNPSGHVKSTRIETGETMEETISSDNDGQNNTVDFNITLTELADGTFSADGSVTIMPEMTYSGGAGNFFFIDLPVRFERTVTGENETRKCIFQGDAPENTEGEFTHSFYIVLSRDSLGNTNCSAQVTDNEDNILIDLYVDILRRGGNGSPIAFSNLNHETDSDMVEEAKNED